MEQRDEMKLTATPTSDNEHEVLSWLPGFLSCLKGQVTKHCWRDHSLDIVEVEILCLLPGHCVSPDELGYTTVTRNSHVSVAKHKKILFFTLLMPNTRRFGHIHHTEEKRKTRSQVMYWALDASAGSDTFHLSLIKSQSYSWLLRREAVWPDTSIKGEIQKYLVNGTHVFYITSLQSLLLYRRPAIHSSLLRLAAEGSPVTIF